MEDNKKGRSYASRLLSREAVLLISLAALGLMFGAAKLSTAFYRGKQADLAKLWFERGSAALQRNDPKEAIEDLRNALSYSPGDASYQLQLAQALAADDRIDEAEAYLLDLWNKEPGSGEINLELARLETKKNDADAAHYYDNAINGVWEKNPISQRWEARMELFHYWLSQGNSRQARAELLAMAADIPEDDYQRQAQIGQLQMEAGDPRAALEQFRPALEGAERAKKRLPAALAGAGEAEFAIGEYPQAIQYLEAAVRADPKNTQAAKKLQVARLVLDSDPFQIGLSDQARTERAINAYLQAQSMLNTCATQRGVQLQTDNPQNQLQITWANGQLLQSMLKQLRHQPENVLKLMDFVFTTENLAAQQCGPLEGKDQALWLIGKKHQLTETNAQGAR